MKLCNLKRYFATGFAIMISVSLFAVVSAQEQPSIEGLMREDVVAMASADLTKVNLLKLNQWATKTGIISEKEAGEFKFRIAAAQGILGGLVDSGVERISVLFQISDIKTQNPIWVASVKESGDTSEAQVALEEVLKLVPLPPQVLFIKDGHILGGPTQEAIGALLSSKSSTNPRLSSAIAAGRQHAVSLVITGNQETRRVVREMFPNLPKPFSEATGPLIADKISWGGLFLDLPPEVDLKIELQTTDEASAEPVGRLSEAAVRFAVENLPTNLRDKFEKTVLEKVSTEVTGSQVVISGKTLLADKAFIESVVEVTSKKRQRQREADNLRQVMLAILNYESAKQKFPSFAITSDAGAPLLSWRVAILPYLDQDELYNQFHLDEPWNSPHNLPLADKMPAVYRAFESAPSIEPNKTAIQVPHGEGLLFEGQEPLGFGDVTDGSSNTIAVVSTNPKQAVCWTKPEDWQADLENPWEGLRRADGASIYVALCDSSVILLDSKTSDEDLSALLTRGGGELVNVQSLR